MASGTTANRGNVMISGSRCYTFLRGPTWPWGLFDAHGMALHYDNLDCFTGVLDWLVMFPASYFSQREIFYTANLTSIIQPSLMTHTTVHMAPVLSLTNCSVDLAPVYVGCRHLEDNALSAVRPPRCRTSLTLSA